MKLKNLLISNSKKNFSIVANERNCILGEGALWHPIRKQFFWFDIIDKKLLSLKEGIFEYWQFDENISAAGWIDESSLLIASENNLFMFDLETMKRTNICDLEINNKSNRSNDGCADPWGGFWVGTMSKKAELNKGAIYRFYDGTLTKLCEGITIPNSICFSRDMKFGFYSDTKEQKIYRYELDKKTGSPKTEAEVFFDFSRENYNPDGMTVDIDNNLWCALWGSSKIVCISKQGSIIDYLNLPVKQPTCLSFGGEDFGTLFITSATEGLEKIDKKDGQTLKINIGIYGNPEFRVLL
tara:strand:+ start:1991 stop:2881 length:891 start_codon:yes stop_codon:yes gene_type:complete